jgi:glutamate/aspartate transport system permease protein
MNLDFSFYNWDLISNFVLKGLYFSLMLTLVATIGGVLFGTVLALMRLSGRKWLDVPATIYVNGMRSIPLVMVILWFFLLMPAIIGRPIGAELSAVVTFIAFEAAYFSEVIRAGIQSIPRGQSGAALALGLTACGSSDNGAAATGSNGAGSKAEYYHCPYGSPQDL